MISSVTGRSARPPGGSWLGGGRRETGGGQSALGMPAGHCDPAASVSQSAEGPAATASEARQYEDPVGDWQLVPAASDVCTPAVLSPSSARHLTIDLGVHVDVSTTAQPVS